MIVSELIKKLSEMPQDSVVVILDYNKNVKEDFGDGSHEGIYSFEVDRITEVPDGKGEFVALTFIEE